MPLHEAIPIDGIRRELDRARTADTDEHYTQAVIEMLPSVLEPIRRSMRHTEDTHGPNAQTTVFDTLKTTGLTNCFGYTRVTSEALGLLGIKHWIATIGRHATTVLPLQHFGRTGLYVADGLSQQYNSYVTPALFGSSVERMQQEMEDQGHPRGVGLLDLHRLSESYELLRHKPTYAMGGSYIGLYERCRTLVLSTMHRDIGLRALKGTASFYVAVEHGDYEHAADAMRQIPGLYYDIDARASHDEIQEAVAGLCEAEKFDTALQLIEDYCSSFARTKDVRFTVLRADLEATVARKSRNLELYEKAMAGYRSAAARTTLPTYSTATSSKAAELTASFRPKPTVIGTSSSKGTYLIPGQTDGKSI